LDQFADWLTHFAQKTRFMSLGEYSRLWRERPRLLRFWINSTGEPNWTHNGEFESFSLEELPQIVNPDQFEKIALDLLPRSRWVVNQVTLPGKTLFFFVLALVPLSWHLGWQRIRARLLWFRN
jgi:hypothetical protein